MQAPRDVFRALESVEPAEFGAYFSTFQQEAFRFEMLPEYLVPQEAPYLTQYEQGKPCPKEFNNDWLSLVKASKAGGKVIHRVRYVSQHGPSAYLKFEVDWGYARSIEAGEAIRILEGLPLRHYESHVPIFNDFWLFDSDQCFIMFYDALGRFLGVKRMPRSITEDYVRFAQTLKADSVPLQQTLYLK